MENRAAFPGQTAPDATDALFPYQILNPKISGPDPQWGMQLAQGCEDRERRNATGLWIVGRDIFDREREPGRVGVDLDGVAVALDGGIGPDFGAGLVGP